MISRRILLAAVTLLVGAALVSCGEDGPGRSSKVFVAPPWEGPEMLTYALEQRGVENVASCVLKTEPGFEPGHTRLSRLCSDNRGNRDDGVVIVDSETLEPLRSTRVTFDAERNRETTHSIVYEGGEARFATTSGDRTRETTRELPKPTEESPEPGWYDDESLLWLVRGIRLEEGYEGHYTHVINAGQPRVREVTVSVHAKEAVEVPAGRFETWRVRVTTGGLVYTFWVGVEDPYRVVQAQIEDSTYRLQRAE